MMRTARAMTMTACVVALTTPLCAQRARPHIGYVYPAGSRQGAELELIVGGRTLAGIARAYISGTGIETFAFGYSNPENPPTPAIAETVTIRVTIARDAPSGPRELRLETPGGLSNPLVFYVGQLPELREKERRSATSIKEVMDIPLPSVVNGQIMPGDIDRFRFRARRGQRLVFSLQARDLVPYLADAVPGWFQAVLALYDDEGRELKLVDDFRFRPDPVLSFEVPRDGRYTVAVYDAIYRGREDFVYRLAAGELPYVTSVFPLGGQVETPTPVTLQGWHLPEPQRDIQFDAPGVYPLFERKKHDKLSERKLDLLIDAKLSSSADSVFRTESVSNRVPFRVDTLPDCAEQEPNDSQQSAQNLRLPMIINGRIDRPGDWDQFRFEGRKGQIIFAEVFARRLESPLDSVLRLTTSEGKQIAFNDDHEDAGAGLVTHHADSYLTAKLPADGAYFVALGDIEKHGGPEFAYRLRISPPHPDFELRIVPSSINMRGGETVPLTVHALRRDEFSGPIDLSLKQAPGGFKLSGAQVPDNQDQVRLTLTAPTSSSDRPLTLALQGSATIGGRTIVRPVVPAEDMMQAFGYRHLVPVNELKAVVTGRFATNTSVALLSSLPVRIPRGGSATIQLGLPARSAFRSVHLELDEPPAGVTIAKELTNARGTEIHFAADKKETPLGLKGNLIVKAFVIRKEEADQKTRARGRPIPLGILPAIPFEIVDTP